MKKYFTSLILLIIIFSCTGKPQSIISKGTTIENRASFHDKLIHETIESALQSNDQEKWLGAIWGMGLSQYRSPITDNFFDQRIDSLYTFPIDIQRGFLEAIYGLYPEKYQENLKSQLMNIYNPKIFAMMANYIHRNDSVWKEHILVIMEKNFPNWEQEAILYSLFQSLNPLNQVMPQLEELIYHDFNGKPMVISFQRRNRNYNGLTVIQKANGEFVKDEFDRILAIPQLARSCSSLPGYITNGNSPQGIYAIVGTDFSDNVFIGQTETLQLRMPFETNPQDFGIDDSTWTLENYNGLLPESWHEYFGIMGTFYAGKAGRSEIIAHGTTINPEYYRDFPFYPNSPSLGCITATELWDSKTGERIFSDQQSLINGWKSLKAENGYFILIEIDMKEQDVTLQELLPLLLKLE